jgi:membrane protease YdiL (CAAX protease family)
MEIPADDPWLNGLANVAVFGSAAAWFLVLARWRRRGEVLPLEPRQPVPWGPPATILAVVLVAMALSSHTAPDVADQGNPDPTATQVAVQLIAWTFSQLVMAGGFFFVVAAFSGATREDCGLPRSAQNGLRDIAIGTIACFAALLPVRIVQGVLLWLIGRQDEISQHPLIETIRGGTEPSVTVMLLATLSAVVVAPICEELTFRLLLQGWLEKWEDARLDSRPSRTQGEPPDEFNPLSGLSGAPTAAEPRTTGDSLISEVAVRDASMTTARPPVISAARPGVFGFPHGWVPIVASSLLFGLAHWGYGPEPVPLFLLAIFLGYVYQRTHRVVPCIVTHALFNLVSMVALWRIAFHVGQ